MGRKAKEIQYKRIDRLGSINRWSFSRWKLYQDCPRAYKFKYIDYLEPIDVGNKWAAVGQKNHEGIEEYINGEKDTLGNSIKYYREFIKELRDIKKEDGIERESEMMIQLGDGFKKITPFDRDVYFICYLDYVMINHNIGMANILDWKTGYKYGKYLNQQSELYLIALLSQYSDINEVNMSFVFTSIDTWIDGGEMSREELPRAKDKWMAIFNKISLDNEWKKNKLKHCSTCVYRTVCNSGNVDRHINCI